MSGSASTATYKLKTVEFIGRKVPIVLQNKNGPCPLLVSEQLPTLRHDQVLQEWAKQQLVLAGHCKRAAAPEPGLPSFGSRRCVTGMHLLALCRTLFGDQALMRACNPCDLFQRMDFSMLTQGIHDSHSFLQ